MARTQHRNPELQENYSLEKAIAPKHDSAFEKHDI